MVSNHPKVLISYSHDRQSTRELAKGYWRAGDPFLRWSAVSEALTESEAGPFRPEKSFLSE